MCNPYSRGEHGHVACNGTGWIRPPVDLYRLLTPEALGGLQDWRRVALIWVNAVRVAAGRGPIRALRGARVVRGPLRLPLRNLLWRLNPAEDFGNIEPDDDAMLVCGQALIDITPEGPVIRAEVPDAP